MFQIKRWKLGAIVFAFLAAFQAFPQLTGPVIAQ